MFVPFSDASHELRTDDLHEQWTNSAVTWYVWAADVLSDETSRSLYDRFGPEGMKQQAGADSGRGNARQVRKRKRNRKQEKSEKIGGRLGDRTPAGPQVKEHKAPQGKENRQHIYHASNATQLQQDFILRIPGQMNLLKANLLHVHLRLTASSFFYAPQAQPCIG